MSARVVVIVGTVLLFAPLKARAVTIDDIVALSKAGVAESVLIAVIDADQTVFTLTPQQIIELKRAGVADSVVTKMVLSAREIDGSGPRDEAPSVVIIGDKPPEPVPPVSPSFTVVTPVLVPVPVNLDRGHRRGPSHAPPPQQPPLSDRGPGTFINDRRVEDSAASHTAVCVRGGWVGWCSAR
jgi:hypothetical protein